MVKKSKPIELRSKSDIRKGSGICQKSENFVQVRRFGISDDRIIDLIEKVKNDRNLTKFPEGQKSKPIAAEE
jgi:hypothetical protein